MNGTTIPILLSIERGNLKNEIISILCNETILLQNSSLIKTPRDNLRWYTGYKRREILTDELSSIELSYTIL